MKNLGTLNPTQFFCSSGICAASDCRCPKVEPIEYPSPKEWWSDPQHRRITLYMAGIAAICIAVYVYGSFQR